MEENYDDDFNHLEYRENNKILMLFGATLSTIIGIIILFYFINKVAETHSLPKNGQILNLTNFGAFGDFIGGFIGTLFSLAGIFFLYITLKEQRENFNKERLENNFFEMIKFHKENVNEIQYSYYEEKDFKVTAEKRKVFKIIYSQFKDLWNEIDFIFKATSIENIYVESYLQELKSKKIFSNRIKDYKELAQIDITYIIVFFGLSKEDKITIETLFKNKYNDQFVENVLLVALLKPKRESDYWKKWEKINNINDVGIKKQIIKSFYEMREDKYNSNLISDLYFNEQTFSVFYKDNYSKYYGGHQFRLGHYYRNVFQNINFINNQVYLSYKEKYTYIKLLRVHLSNYEQILFLLNSLSIIGRDWEYNKSHNLNKQLITKYNLIKNIPNQRIVEGIEPLKYYPSISYEIIKSENKLERKSLTKYYK